VLTVEPAVAWAVVLPGGRDRRPPVASALRPGLTVRWPVAAR